MWKKTTPGHFMGRDAAGTLHDLGTHADAAPDQVICRRVADFPSAIVPAGGLRAVCVRCGAAVVHAGRFPAVPRVCMQCAGILPEPL